MYGLPIVPISTHTPLAGRDGFDARRGQQYCDFYSHAPRGARRENPLSILEPTYFYSHAPRGARPMYIEPALAAFYFYSHAPRGARRLLM